MAGLAALAAASALALTAGPSWGQDAERIAIEEVLTRYRTAVSTGDEPLFLTTVLASDIPFYALSDGEPPEETEIVRDLHGLADFRQRVFHSGRRLSQTFDRIEIEHEGGLAQASLHFVTRVRESERGSEGWKTLILIKGSAGWKIVSEVYTVRPLPTPVGGS